MDTVVSKHRRKSGQMEIEVPDGETVVALPLKGNEPNMNEIFRAINENIPEFEGAYKGREMCIHIIPTADGKAMNQKDWETQVYIIGAKKN